MYCCHDFALSDFSSQTLSVDAGDIFDDIDSGNYSLPNDSAVVELCEDEGLCQDVRFEIINRTLNIIRMRCLAQDSCASSSLLLNHTSVASIDVLCSDHHSCNLMTVVCEQPYSCAYLTVSAMSSMDNSVWIHCIGRWSCDHLRVDLQSLSSSSDSPILHIICYDHQSCDSLSVGADAQVLLSLYEYSNDIRITHSEAERVKLQCGHPEDELFIFYDMSWTYTDEQLLSMARVKYDSQRLPCEGVAVDCIKLTGLAQDCVYENHVGLFNSSNLFGVGFDCAWLELSEVLDAICIGTCGDTVLFVHNQSLETQISLADENMTQQALYAKCAEFFGTVDKADETLQRIDAIFESTLRFVYSYAQIYGIIEGPTSRMSSILVDCNNFEIVQIETWMMLESSIANETSFAALFMDGSAFVWESQSQLSLLFGTSVTVNAVSPLEILVTEAGLSTWEAITVVIGAVVSTVLLLLIAYRVNRMRQRMVMRHPLVIAIGIGQYDDDTPLRTREVSGNLSSLSGIEKDLENLVTLFSVRMKYDVYPAYELNELRTFWTKQDILDLLNEKALYLAQHLDRFDGLVVAFSCHGIDDCILTSDYKRITRQFIHRTFSLSQEFATVRALPRLFILDCCSGDNDQDHFDRGADNDTPDAEADAVTVERKVMTVEARRMTNPWARDEHNPDYRLAIINASNPDFMSKMRSDIGSYMMHFLVEMLTENLSRGGVFGCRSEAFLAEIMLEIQNLLHDEGKQLIVPIYSNGTSHIVFQEKQDGDGAHAMTPISSDPEKQLAEMVHVQTESVAGQLDTVIVTNESAAEALPDTVADESIDRSLTLSEMDPDDDADAEPDLEGISRLETLQSTAL